MYGGIQERGDVELRSNTLIYKHRTEIAGAQAHSHLGNDVKTGHRCRETQGS